MWSECMSILWEWTLSSTSPERKEKEINVQAIVGV